MRRSVERVTRELTWSDDPFGDGVRAADYDCVLNRIHYLTVVYQSREVDLSQHSGVLEGRRQQSGEVWKAQV